MTTTSSEIIALAGSIILAVLALLGILIPILIKENKTSLFIKIVIIILIAFLIIISLFLMCKLQTPERIPANSELSIKTPKNNSTVGQRININGKYDFLKSIDRIYVVIHNLDNSILFPQERKIVVNKNKWEYKNIEIGSSADIRKEFEIIIVEVDSVGKKDLSEYFKQIDSSGLFKIPSGIILDKIKVRRGA